MLWKYALQEMCAASSWPGSEGAVFSQELQSLVTLCVEPVVSAR
jgi:hypothetical protein